MTELTSRPPVVETLTDAADTYRNALAAVEEYGHDSLEQVREAHEETQALLSQYEDQATDTGIQEFVRFAEFKQSFEHLVESLADDLPAVEAFENAYEAIDKRRLTQEDFARARENLAPVQSRIELLDDLAAARDDLIEARLNAATRREELIADRDRLTRVKQLGTTDLDRSLEPIQEPIDTYNAGVKAAFKQLRTETSAREFFALLTRAQRYPLIKLQQPPEELLQYLETSPAGTKSVSTLLTWLEYSPSKLRHYVDDPTAFRRAVATERSFLAELTADPLTIDWPPPAADVIPYLTRSRRRVIGSYLDADEHRALRRLEAVARDKPRYSRLRETAVARSELTAAELEAVKTGAIEEQLAETTNAIEAIETALAETPDP